jgi:hypothetical protein
MRTRSSVSTFVRSLDVAIDRPSKVRDRSSVREIRQLRGRSLSVSCQPTRHAHLRWNRTPTMTGKDSRALSLLIAARLVPTN